MVDRTRERRLRRAAERRGFKYSRNARRDQLAIDYGTITLTDVGTGKVVLTTQSMEEAERFVDTPRSELRIAS